MRFGGILFDKDGTLFDYHATWDEVFQQLARDLSAGDTNQSRQLLEVGGYDFEQRAYHSNSLLAAGDTRELARAWGKLLGRDEAELLKQLEEVFSHAPVARAVPAADLDTLLGVLTGRSLSLGIATHDSRLATENVLARFSLQSYFDFISGYDSGHGAKPGAGMALAFCESVGVSPERIVVVGDNPHDMGMGRAAGAGAVLGVLTGSSRREDLAGLADGVLTSIAELPDWLDQNAGS